MSSRCCSLLLVWLALAGWASVCDPSEGQHRFTWSWPKTKWAGSGASPAATHQRAPPGLPKRDNFNGRFAPSQAQRQSPLAWTEDRALLRSNPSADSGAKTGAEAGRECLASLLMLRSWPRTRLRDWQERAKPPRHDAAGSGSGRPSHHAASRSSPRANPLVAAKLR